LKFLILTKLVATMQCRFENRLIASTNADGSLGNENVLRPKIDVSNRAVSQNVQQAFVATTGAFKGGDVTFIPCDSDWETRIRDSFGRQFFMAELKAHICRAEPGRVELSVAFREALTQQHGYFHAGVLASIADSAGGYAGYSLFPKNSSVLTVEFKLNLLRPAQGDRLRAIGQVVKLGRTLSFCDLSVLADDAGSEILCASGQQTLICLHDRIDGR
jgi:uncharacterized protein (TIGR00369 family)